MSYFNLDGAQYNIEDAFNLVSKMDMGGGSSMSSPSNSTGPVQPSCKISMLWNWYTIDSCFISRTWHVSTKGQFAGSCIGVFLLVLSAQWLHRVSREYDAAIARRRYLSLNSSKDVNNDSSVEKDESSTSLDEQEERNQATMYSNNDFLQPIIFTLSHKWIWDFQQGTRLGKAYPNLLEHLIRAAIFTIQWGQSYIIMLLFMYYNGYIIISCLLGAFFGRLLFNYEPITCVTREDSLNNDKKCCL